MDSKGYHDQKASFGPKKATQQYDVWEKIDFSSLFWSCVLKYLSYITNSTKQKKKYAKSGRKNFKENIKIFFGKAFFDFSKFLLILGLNTKLNLYF